MSSCMEVIDPKVLAFFAGVIIGFTVVLIGVVVIYWNKL